jgi:hypothetical protein
MLHTQWEKIQWNARPVMVPLENPQLQKFMKRTGLPDTVVTYGAKASGELRNIPGIA